MQVLTQNASVQKTVLVADDDPDVTNLLALRLKQLGLLVMRSPDATHALVGTQRIRPDLLILDVKMPGGNGLAVAEMLACDNEFCRLPIIIHTGCNDQLTRVRCVHPTHYYVQKSPHSWNEIKTIVCRELGIDSGEASESAGPQLDAAGTPPAQCEQSADTAQTPAADVLLRETSERAAADTTAGEGTRHRTGKRGLVLCIDDDPDVSNGLKMRLAGYGVEVLRAFNGMQGYWTAVGEKPDVIVCDMVMPDGDGNYIFSRFKSHPLTENIPLIILTGQCNPALKRTMMSLGAAAYLNKPLVFNDLLSELRAYLDLPEQPDPFDFRQMTGTV